MTKKSVRVSECFLQSRKKCIPKMEGGKVHLPMIGKMLTFGASPRRYGTPVAIVL
jgi:hypothetical protein